MKAASPGPARRPRLAVRVIIALVAIQGLIAVVGLWRAGAPGAFGGDFIAYVAAANQVRAEGWHRLYDLGLQEQFEQALLATSGLDLSTLQAIPFNYPPPMLLAVLPLAALPAPTAVLLWVALNAVLVVCGCAIALRAGVSASGRSKQPSANAALLALACFPAVWGLLAGQPVGLMLLVYALFTAALLGQNEVEAGLWLSLLAVVKPQLVVMPALALLALRRWRALASLAGGGALLVLLTLLLVGPAGIADYLHLLNAMDGFRGNPALAVQVDRMVNWHAWLARWPGLSTDAGFLATNLLDALTLLLTLLLWRRGATEPSAVARALLCFTAAGIVGSYHSHLQDLTLLLPPAAVLIVMGTGYRTVPRALWLAAATLTVGLSSVAWLVVGVAALGWLTLWNALAVPGLLLLVAASRPAATTESPGGPSDDQTAIAVEASAGEVAGAVRWSAMFSRIAFGARHWDARRQSIQHSQPAVIISHTTIGGGSAPR